MEDIQIIALYQQRSHEALLATEARYGRLIQSIAKNILGNEEDAQECANDTYLAVWNSIPPQNPVSFMSYICKIVKNQALMRIRHDKTKKRSAEVVAIDELIEVLPGKSLEDEILAKELGKQIAKFLENMEKTDRIVFMRRYWYGDPVYDIANDLHMTANGVSMRLHKQRKKLKQYLEKEGLVDGEA